MSRECEGSAMRGHDGFDVLQPVDRDALQELRKRAHEKRTQLDKDQAEMLTGLTVNPAAFGGAPLGKNPIEIRQRQPPSARKETVCDVADTAAHPGRHRQGESPYRRGQAGHPAADDFRRSRRISIGIGRSESTITMSTTMWTWRSMFGTVWPRRYPAQVMLTTHPIPPAT